jgi:hypothetical protein
MSYGADSIIGFEPIPHESWTLVGDVPEAKDEKRSAPGVTRTPDLLIRSRRVQTTDLI